MAPKPKRSWTDVQMAVMTIAMTAVLGLWNLFAGTDRETALRKAAEELANQPEPVEAPPEQPVQVHAAQIPLPEPGDKIMLGGTAPQTQVFVQTGGKRGGGGGGDGGGGGGSGGGGGGGGGGAVTSTSSS